jgi:hypothetical protein
MPRDTPSLIDTANPNVVTRSQYLLVSAIIVAGICGFLLTPPPLAAAAVMQAGPELTTLMRGMALLKSFLALAALMAVMWRLRGPISAPWLISYVMACAAMAAGPAVIWNMAYVRCGAVLLHGGLAACIVLLWRDWGMALRLDQAIAARRARLRAGHN